MTAPNKRSAAYRQGLADGFSGRSPQQFDDDNDQRNYDAGFWTGTHQRLVQGIIDAVVSPRRPTLRAQREKVFLDFLLRSRR